VVRIYLLWDDVAGALIAREAGAVVVDSTGARHSLSAQETIAATASIADLLLALVRQAGYQDPPP
jgi:myo-inositol-1(or 4)-monophosphatase